MLNVNTWSFACEPLLSLQLFAKASLRGQEKIGREEADRENCYLECKWNSRLP